MKKIYALFLLGLSSQCLAIEVAPGVEQLYEREELTGNALSGHIEKVETPNFFGYWLAALTQSYSGRVNHKLTI